MVDWLAFNEAKFLDDLSQIHVDTRDFCILILNEKFDLNISKLKNYPDRFFHTIEDVKSILENLYNRSGGQADWRYLSLKGEGEKASENWNLKYIRVYKTEMGFAICGNDNKALSKSVLNSEMESKEILNTH